MGNPVKTRDKRYAGITPYERTQRIRGYGKPVAVLAGECERADIPTLAALASGPMGAEAIAVERRVATQK